MKFELVGVSTTTSKTIIVILLSSLAAKTHAKTGWKTTAFCCRRDYVKTWPYECDPYMGKNRNKRLLRGNTTSDDDNDDGTGIIGPIQMFDEQGNYDLTMEEEQLLLADRALLDYEEDNNEEESAIAIFNEQQQQHRELGTRETFTMKLYWDEQSCWQEERIERKWCMECFSETECKNGDIVWLQDCENDKSSQRFEWLATNPGDNVEGKNFGRLKAADKNLCFTKAYEEYTKSTQSIDFYYKMRACNDDPNFKPQLFSRSSLNNVFEMYPYNKIDEMCINQQHHPKWGEEIQSTTCFIAKKWHTNRWQMIWRKTESGNGSSSSSSGGGGGSTSTSTTTTRNQNANKNNNNDDDDDDDDNDNTKRLSLRNNGGECTNNRPCGRCKGDCDNDNQCSGGLKCWQRDKDGPNDIPGCSGEPEAGRDYCYRP